MWTEIHSGSFYRNSLSSKMGATGIMYGAEAGTGPGVWADGKGDLRPESSELIPEPLIWIAANTFFFLQALQRHRQICKFYGETSLHYKCDSWITL